MLIDMYKKNRSKLNQLLVQFDLEIQKKDFIATEDGVFQSALLGANITSREFC